MYNASDDADAVAGDGAASAFAAAVSVGHEWIGFSWGRSSGSY